MKPKDIEETERLIKDKRWKAVLYILLPIVLLCIGAYFFGFFGEKGRQSATTKDSGSEGKLRTSLQVEQVTKGDGSPSVVIKGDIIGSEINIQGGGNTESYPEAEGPSKNELEKIVIYPEELSFTRKLKPAKCDFFVENTTDKTIYSIEFEAMIDDLDQRCEEIKIVKKGEPDKAFELNLQGQILNYETNEFPRAVKDDGRRVYYVRIARLGPKTSMPFSVTFESNCRNVDISGEKLSIPLTILNYGKVPPPTISRQKNIIFFEYPMGSLSLNLDHEKIAKYYEKIKLDKKEFLDLLKKANVEIRPLVIPILFKDKSSGTYPMIRKMDGTRDKYQITFSFFIMNIGNVAAKEVMWRKSNFGVISSTIGKHIDLEKVKKEFEKAKLNKPDQIRRELGPWEHVTCSFLQTMYFENDSTPEVTRYIYDTLFLKWETTYKHPLNQKQTYKTTGIYQIKKDQYSIISMQDE